MEEIWRDIKGYEGLYQVSNLGRVRSLNKVVNGRNSSKRLIKGKIIKPYISNKGYFVVSLYKEGKGKKYLVHRLVAQAFIPNPDNLPEVNHIDETPKNCKVENLEWCSHQYNNQYGSKPQTISKKLSIPVLQYSLEGEFIKKWASAQQVQNELGYNKAHIRNCCLGRKNYNTAYGYIWKEERAA